MTREFTGKRKLKEGDRVGAIRSQEEGEVFFFGYGVYEGEHTPPFGPFGMPLDEFNSLRREGAWRELKYPHKWEVINGELNYVPLPELEREPTEEEISEYLSQHPFTNPRILLDSGEHVWGLQCWWGSEEQVKKRLEGLKVTMVAVEA